MDKKDLTLEDVAEIKKAPLWSIILRDVPVDLKDEFWDYTKTQAAGNPKSALKQLLNLTKLGGRVDTIEERVKVMEDEKDE